MIEKSMFNNDDEIRTWVNEKYELVVQSINVQEIGSANCFILQCINGNYFMKEFQSKIKSDNLSTEIEICKFIENKGIPTSIFLKDKMGSYISKYKEKCITIQKYIDGSTYAMNTLPDCLLFSSARYLGKINRYMNELNKLNESFDDEWLNGWSNEKEIEKIQKLLDDCDQNIDEKIMRKIYEDFNFKISKLREMKGYAKRFIGSYRCNSHGDYSLLQLLCKNSEIIAIVDFASVCCIPPTWEIIRSYTYGASECKGGDKINFEKFKIYLDEYLSENPIPKKDIILMPSLYFFNLVRSTFGYKQLLQGKTNSILEFAFWRTNMCRWLYNHIEEFEKFLKENYL